MSHSNHRPLPTTSPPPSKFIWCFAVYTAGYPSYLHLSNAQDNTMITLNSATDLLFKLCKNIAMSLPESTETRWNLRHSEQSERGGKVPEWLRVIQLGMKGWSLSEGVKAGTISSLIPTRLCEGCLWHHRHHTASTSFL